MQRARFLLLLGVSWWSFAIQANDSALYYEAHAPFSEASHAEIQLVGGYEYSNPYLNIYPVGISSYVFLSQLFATGIEFSKFYATEKQSTQALRSVLGPYGLEIAPSQPDWNLVFAVRFTPLAGMVNLFSSRVMSADISILLRGGMVRTMAGNSLPLIGTGMQVHLGVTPNVGILAALLWDADYLTGSGWESRVGFRAGPSVRF